MHDIWEIRRTKELLLKLFGGTATTLKTVKKEHFYMFFYFDEKESNMEAKGFSGNEIQEDKTIVGSDEVIVNVAEAEEKSTDLEKKETDKGAGETQKEKPESGGNQRRRFPGAAPSGGRFLSCLWRGGDEKSKGHEVRGT